LSPGRAVRLLLLLASLGLALVAAGPPTFTWANDGVRIGHPWTQAAAALGAALAVAAAAVGERRRWLQAAAGVAGLALVGLAAEQLAFRFEAVEAGVRERSLAGASSLRWTEIEAVEPRPGSLALRGRGGAQLVIATDRFPPDDRVRLERTIARRVKEAAR
jgi:hypothetical protein